MKKWLVFSHFRHFFRALLTPSLRLSRPIVRSRAAGRKRNRKGRVDAEGSHCFTRPLSRGSPVPACQSPTSLHVSKSSRSRPRTSPVTCIPRRTREWPQLPHLPLGTPAFPARRSAASPPVLTDLVTLEVGVLDDAEQVAERVA